MGARAFQSGHSGRVADTRALDPTAKQEWVAWLESRSPMNTGTGFDAGGWEASTWVLHAIYEDPSIDDQGTHDELHRQRVASGLESPTIVNGVNLSESTVVTGGTLGMSGPVGVESERLTWHDVAGRLSVDLIASAVPPCFRWFPYRSWPVGLHPPDEGSLDQESLSHLSDVLARQTSGGADARCIAYYSPLACGDWEEPWLREVDLGKIGALVDRAERRVGSPSNWWPIDKSWMVFTDWDLWATKVSGTAALISAIKADEHLETIDWQPAPS